MRRDPRPLARAMARRLADWLRALGRAVVATRAEWLTAAAFLAGWGLVTAFVAALTAPLAWLLSLGLLAFSLGGWRLAWTIATRGLYTLTREARLTNAGARRG